MCVCVCVCVLGEREREIGSALSPDLLWLLCAIVGRNKINKNCSITFCIPRFGCSFIFVVMFSNEN